MSGMFVWVKPEFVYSVIKQHVICRCNTMLRHSVVSDSVTPWTVAHQAPLSMGFSRQQSWSSLPCPPPGDLPNPGIKPQSPALQVDSLLSEPLGKPKNPGVGSLSLLQGIFSAQESNWGLLHCRQVLHYPSYQGSPDTVLLHMNIYTSGTDR